MSRKAFWQPQVGKLLSELSVFELFAVGAGVKCALENPEHARKRLAEIERELEVRGRKLELTEDDSDA